MGVVVIDEDRFREIVREELSAALESSRPPTETKALTVKEAADFLGIGVNKCYDLTRRRGFPALREGNRIMIPRDGLRRWLEQEALLNPGGMECVSPRR